MVSAADRLLVGSCLLLFIDSFLNWQPGLNAWGGSAAFAGVLMALFALLQFAGGILLALRVTLPAGLPEAAILAGLTVGTVLFGIIKFLFAVANQPKAAAWIGLVLLLVVALGGYLKMREERVGPPPAGFTP